MSSDAPPPHREGILRKLGGLLKNKWQERHFVLHNHTLVWYEEPDKRKELGSVAMHTVASVEPVLDQPLQFVLRMREGKDYVLMANAGSELKAWMADLKLCAGKHPVAAAPAAAAAATTAAAAAAAPSAAQAQAAPAVQGSVRPRGVSTQVGAGLGAAVSQALRAESASMATPTSPVAAPVAAVPATRAAAATATAVPATAVAAAASAQPARAVAASAARAPAVAPLPVGARGTSASIAAALGHQRYATLTYARGVTDSVVFDTRSGAMRLDSASLVRIDNMAMVGAKEYKEGDLQKLGGGIVKHFQLRHFVLRNCKLEYFEGKRPAGVMDLREAKSVDPASNDPLAFRIVMPDKEYLLKALTEDERDEWCLCIVYAILMLRKRAADVEAKEEQVVRAPDGVSFLSFGAYQTLYDLPYSVSASTSTNEFVYNLGAPVLHVHVDEPRPCSTLPINWLENLRCACELRLPHKPPTERFFIVSSEAVEKKHNHSDDKALWTCWMVHARSTSIEVVIAIARRHYLPPNGATYQDLTFELYGPDKSFSSPPGKFSKVMRRLVQHTFCAKRKPDYDRNAVQARCIDMAGDVFFYRWAFERDVVPPLLAKAAQLHNLVVRALSLGIRPLPGVPEVPPGDVDALLRSILEDASCTGETQADFAVWRAGVSRFLLFVLNGGLSSISLEAIAGLRGNVQCPPEAAKLIDTVADLVLCFRSPDESTNSYLPITDLARSWPSSVQFNSEAVGPLLRSGYVRARVGAKFYLKVLFRFIQTLQVAVVSDSDELPNAHETLAAVLDEFASAAAYSQDYSLLTGVTGVVLTVFRGEILLDNDRQLTASALLTTSLLHALVNLTSDCDQTQTLVSRPEYAIEKQLTRMLCSSMPQGVLALSADLLRNVAPALGERAVSLVSHLRSLLECHDIPGVQQDKRLVASIIGALWSMASNSACRQAMLFQNILPLVLQHVTVSGFLLLMCGFEVGVVPAVLDRIGVIASLLSASHDPVTVRNGLALLTNLSTSREFAAELRKAPLTALYMHCGQLAKSNGSTTVLRLLSVLQTNMQRLGTVNEPSAANGDGGAGDGARAGGSAAGAAASDDDDDDLVLPTPSVFLKPAEALALTTSLPKAPNTPELTAHDGSAPGNGSPALGASLPPSDESRGRAESRQIVARVQGVNRRELYARSTRSGLGIGLALPR